MFLTNPRYNATFGVIFNSHGPKFPHIIWAISYGSYDLSVGRFQVAFQFTCNILSLKSFICLIVDSGCIFVLHKYNKRRSHCRFNSPVLNVEWYNRYMYGIVGGERDVDNKGRRPGQRSTTTISSTSSSLFWSTSKWKSRFSREWLERFLRLAFIRRWLPPYSLLVLPPSFR